MKTYPADAKHYKDVPCPIEYTPQYEITSLEMMNKYYKDYLKRKRRRYNDKASIMSL